MRRATRLVQRTSASLLPVSEALRVRLREITLDDVELVDEWQADPVKNGEFNSFGGEVQTIRPGVEEGRIIGPNGGMMIVERLADAQPIGTVGWHAVRYGPNDESRAWNIGISLVPEARGQGYGPEAQLLLADHLFATTHANRVEASTDVENLAEQRALDKAGFVREGVNRGAQWRAEGYHDLVLYSRLRGDA
jgi:RimJ/RimL family protein N-acetyltransferase